MLRGRWEQKPGVDGEQTGAGDLPGHGLTFWPLDAGVLVVAEEEAFPAVAFVAAHHVDAALLAAAIPLSTLIHICAGQEMCGFMV